MGSANINSAELGERLRVIRESRGFTQAAIASRMELARTTLLAIEKGTRRIKNDELRRLASVYETSVNELLRRESVHIDLVPRFRSLRTTEDMATTKAAQILTNFVRAEVELEGLLGIERSRNYPPERPLMFGDVQSQAESDAMELRQWLGLGMSRAVDLVAMLELDMGVRLYMCPLDSKISGLFAFDDSSGACMLLNANHPPERRRQSIAHELGHFIATRRSPEVLLLDKNERSREERYANAFGRTFLTPARAVQQQFQRITAGSSRLTRRHIILLAFTFGVSREAIVRRLEELGLTKSGTWDWFESNGGISNAQARQALNGIVDVEPETRSSVPSQSIRLNALAAEAWHQGLASEGQLARLLRIDRIIFREMIDTLDIEGGVDVNPKLPR
tara:strand:+ start:26032 stop:27207 length:1176 start_codon:yes stop_codon:yes gene_type:complete